MPHCKPLIMTLLLIVGCGYTVDEYTVGQAEAICTLYDDCAIIGTFEDFQTYDTCLDHIQAQQESVACDAFDKKSAEDCIDGVNQMDCYALQDQAWPAACDKVCP